MSLAHTACCKSPHEPHSLTVFVVITQWSVFAIRNLCEDNQENKAVIAALKMEGLSDSVSLLNEMGVTAEIRDEKLVVKPVPKS